ncbi:MAG: hypothetical protein JKY04_03325 [Sneathiella sp.]|nr:hypothetical protein [Sneathiella sp.]MBL4898729.1 hypothetical protein [Colwellia sp.]
MDEEEAERQVMKLYNTDYSTVSGKLSGHQTNLGALPFYTWLESNHPEVLTLPCKGDRYQTIKTWIGL